MADFTRREWAQIYRSADRRASEYNAQHGIGDYQTHLSQAKREKKYSAPVYRQDRK